MNDLTITVTGWVATTPAFVVRKDGQPTDMCTFRVAQTPRRFDRDSGSWVDKKTEWFDIRVRGKAAVFVEKSVHKGEPVIVAGRLQTDEWATQSGGARFALQVNASAIGHDLSRGIATFKRAIVENGEIEMLPGKPSEPGPEGEAGGDATAEGTDAEIDGSDVDEAFASEEEAAQEPALAAS
ncbi:single-stranded DNA-binding protein [Demequina flava]|uniref:single-stranded DNA-binding protein n=1 Tax=Demequina flava TaxID=1095025 RepID=UPI000781445F|nr:single-stranded DNA-binding protein [Demequina flava]